MKKQFRYIEELLSTIESLLIRVAATALLLFMLFEMIFLGVQNLQGGINRHQPNHESSAKTEQFIDYEH